MPVEDEEQVPTRDPVRGIGLVTTLSGARVLFDRRDSRRYSPRCSGSGGRPRDSIARRNSPGRRRDACARASTRHRASLSSRTASSEPGRRSFPSRARRSQEECAHGLAELPLRWQDLSALGSLRLRETAIQFCVDSRRRQAHFVIPSRTRVSRPQYAISRPSAIASAFCSLHDSYSSPYGML
jgi:hypothetical protein